MSVVLLVRHGQASYGTADYDRLSETGARQSRRLGESLTRSLATAPAITSGALVRQLSTADHLVASAHWLGAVNVDPRWNEFDHAHFLSDRMTGFGGLESGAFQDELEIGMREWSLGKVTGSAPETFDDFRRRTEAALDHLVAGPSGSVAVVVTSAGVISWIAAVLLGGGVEQWIRLNRVCVNSAVTKVVGGRRGAALVTFNDHGHLERADVTYR